MQKTTIPTELKSHFLRLYQIALSDGDFDKLEMKMLYEFAEERGILKEDLDEVLLNPQDLHHLIPESVEQKIEYLCDFASMIWADEVITDDERNSLEKYIRLFGFLDENIHPLADYLLEATKKGKSKLEIINELNS